MGEAERQLILARVQNWFRDVIMVNHIRNVEKLIDPDEFNVNPFLAPYLAGFYSGSLTPQSVAEVLLLPRVLGTSITTSFGTNMQRFITDVLKGTYGSIVPGIDIEFVDAVDGRRKYCQCKLGPQTINRDDVDTIRNHFRSARNLGKTNNLDVQQHDLVVAIMYGEPGCESGHYKALRDTYDHPLYVGADFWHRLTGDPGFYDALRVAIADVAAEIRGSEMLKHVAERLAASPDIRNLAAAS